MNDDYETSIENFEIEDDQNLICDHDNMIYEEIKCEICEKVFKTKILLKNHLETDKGENVTCNDFELKIIKLKMIQLKMIKKVKFTQLINTNVNLVANYFLKQTI